MHATLPGKDGSISPEIWFIHYQSLHSIFSLKPDEALSYQAHWFKSHDITQEMDKLFSVGKKIFFLIYINKIRLLWPFLNYC